MRKLIYSLGVSLDGFINDRNRSIDWSGPDDELHAFHNDRARAATTALYGRRLYELMSKDWPPMFDNPAATPVETEFAQIWLAQEKVVFSTTLTEVAWNSRLVSSDAVAEVERIKAGPGGDIELGGAGLAASLMPHGLIDEYWLFVHPVILGGGTPFFPALDKRIQLRLDEKRQFGNGVFYLRYSPS